LLGFVFVYLGKHAVCHVCGKVNGKGRPRFCAGRDHGFIRSLPAATMNERSPRRGDASLPLSHLTFVAALAYKCGGWFWISRIRHTACERRVASRTRPLGATSILEFIIPGSAVPSAIDSGRRGG